MAITEPGLIGAAAMASALLGASVTKLLQFIGVSANLPRPGGSFWVLVEL